MKRDTASHAVSIRGLKRDLGLDRSRLERLLLGTLAAERAPSGEMTLAFVGDRTMRRLNRDYRGVDATTDVLSFSYVDEPHAADVLGEIYLSPGVARRQARELGEPFPREVARLAVHGLLHVLGYEHDTPPSRRRMLARQERYVKKLFQGEAMNGETITLAMIGAGAVLFLGLLACISAAEQAFLSLTEAQIRRLKSRDESAVDRVMEYVRQPRRVIVTTVVVGGTMGAGAILCVLLALQAAVPLGPGGMLVLALPTGFVVALLGRAVPRAAVAARPENAAFRLIGIFTVLDALFRPLSWLSQRLLDRVSRDSEAEMVAVAEFKAVAEEGEDTPRLQDEKRELIHSIFEFGGTSAKEVMVPRIDMIMADAGSSRRDVLRLIEQHGHSRIPVYDGSVDKIVGAVHVKQLIRNGVVEGNDTPIRDVARPVFFVPESKKIDELLHEFQQNKSHLAIVVDEYGGTSGMVTLEDVLEEIVGEIEDEYDTAETLVEVMPDGSYRVAAKIDIDDLNDEMNLSIPTENSDTLGGFIYELVGKVPMQGEVVDYRDLRFVIDRVNRQRIIRVRIQKAEQART